MIDPADRHRPPYRVAPDELMAFLRASRPDWDDADLHAAITAAIVDGRPWPRIIRLLCDLAVTGADPTDLAPSPPYRPPRDRPVR